MNIKKLALIPLILAMGFSTVSNAMVIAGDQDEKVCTLKFINKEVVRICEETGGGSGGGGGSGTDRVYNPQYTDETPTIISQCNAGTRSPDDYYCKMLAGWRTLPPLEDPREDDGPGVE
jgi:hypothetical protein